MAWVGSTLLKKQRPSSHYARTRASINLLKSDLAAETKREDDYSLVQGPSDDGLVVVAMISPFHLSLAIGKELPRFGEVRIPPKHSSRTRTLHVAKNGTRKVFISVPKPSD